MKSNDLIIYRTNTKRRTAENKSKANLEQSQNSNNNKNAKHKRKSNYEISKDKLNEMQKESNKRRKQMQQKKEEMDKRLQERKKKEEEDNLKKLEEAKIKLMEKQKNIVKLLRLLHDNKFNFKIIFEKVNKDKEEINSCLKYTYNYTYSFPLDGHYYTIIQISPDRYDLRIDNESYMILKNKR